MRTIFLVTHTDDPQEALLAIQPFKEYEDRWTLIPSLLRLWGQFRGTLIGNIYHQLWKSKEHDSVKIYVLDVTTVTTDQQFPRSDAWGPFNWICIFKQNADEMKPILIALGVPENEIYIMDIPS